MPRRHGTDVARSQVAGGIALLCAVETRTLLKATGYLPPPRGWSGGPESSRGPPGNEASFR
ncbi:hypothetical protein [Actinomadura sp. NTSP31]|uniref:hypothetical protein n=1 Tax=Actinomadura sp. NTSP31 TaxID=1735447 RepID=UPI0035C254FF